MEEEIYEPIRISAVVPPKTVEKLLQLTREGYFMTKSEVLRLGIDMVYSDVIPKESCEGTTL